MPLSRRVVEAVVKPVQANFFWIGYVDAYNAVKAEKHPVKDYLLISHNQELGNPFRYRPDTQTVYWWKEPGMDEKIAVEQFLHRKGLSADRHKKMTSMYERPRKVWR